MIHARYAPVRDRLHIVIGNPYQCMLGIIRSLGEEGVRPVVVTIPDRKKLYCTASRYLKELHLENTLHEGLEYIIARYGHAKEKGFLHVTNDISMLACDSRYDELKDSFHIFHAGKQGAMARYFDKKELCDLAIECGLPVPRMKLFPGGEVPQTLRYPIFVKCADPFGAWKLDTEICQSEEELLQAYSHLISDKWLMQEYVDKKTEVSMQGISVRGGEQVYMPLKKTYIRLRDKDYGTYMHYEPNDLPQELIDKIHRLIRTINFSGCFEVEFMSDKEGRLYFLEINMRYSGSNRGMLCGGVNLPMEWALAEQTGTLDESGITPRKDRYYVMNEHLDILLMLHGRVSFREWLRDFRRTECFYVWDWADMRPQLQYGWEFLKRQVAYRIRTACNQGRTK